MSASLISRALFEVRKTSGRRLARMVPISGTVTWKSESTSSRNASNSGSDLSTSSTSSSCGSSAVIARISGRGTMKCSEKKTLSSCPTRSAASRSVVAPAITSLKRSFRICV